MPPNNRDNHFIRKIEGSARIAGNGKSLVLPPDFERLIISSQNKIPRAFEATDIGLQSNGQIIIVGRTRDHLIVTDDVSLQNVFIVPKDTFETVGFRESSFTWQSRVDFLESPRRRI